MTITTDQLTGVPATVEAVAPSTNHTEPEVTIVDWVTEVPKHRRTSPFDPLVDEIRRIGDTTRSAKVAWGDKPISPNKVNQLRKRYPDVEFSQVSVTGGGRDTYVRYTGNPPTK
jgi:hypothetical protein